MKPIKVLHVVSVDKENYYLQNLAGYSDASVSQMTNKLVKFAMDF